MEEKYRLLICLSASVASNCMPCFEHYHARSLEAGLSLEDIRETIELAGQVKRGAHIALTDLIHRIMKGETGDKSENRTNPCSCG